MSTYGLGYRPDPAHRRLQRSSRFLVGQAPPVPRSFSAEHLEAPVLNQSRTGSCTGHGTAQGLVVSCAFAGQPLAFAPSPKGIYGATRAIERAMMTRPDQPLPGLSDVGAMPADVMQALSTYGVRPIEAPSPLGFTSDIDASNVNDEPELQELLDSGKKLITGEYRVDERARDFIEQVCATLTKCGALGIGVFVDRNFMDWAPSSGPITARMLNVTDPEGGGHWLCLTSYDTIRETGGIVFRGPNSWGTAWGDHGHFVVSEDWLRAAIFDCYVFHGPQQGGA